MLYAVHSTDARTTYARTERTHAIARTCTHIGKEKIFWNFNETSSSLNKLVCMRAYACICVQLRAYVQYVRTLYVRPCYALRTT